MAKFRKSQTSFTSGIIGPELRGRIDIGEYANGCLELDNFIGVEHGAVYSRGGMNFIPLYLREDPDTVIQLPEVLSFCSKEVYFFDIDDTEWIGFIGLSENKRVINTQDANYRYSPIGAINIKTGEIVRPEASSTLISEYIYTNDPNYYAWNVKGDLGDTKFLHTRIGNVFIITHTSGKYAPTIVRWLPATETMYAWPFTIFSELSAGFAPKISHYANAQQDDLVESSAAFAQPWASENLNKDLKFKFTRINASIPYTYQVELVDDSNLLYDDYAGTPLDPLNRGRLFRFGFPNLAPTTNEGFVFMYYAGYRDIYTVPVFTGDDVDDTTDTFNVDAHGLVNDDPVVFSSSQGVFPAGLQPNRPYFVVNATTNTFQLSLTTSGTPVDLVKGLQGELSIESIDLRKIDLQKAIFQEVWNYVNPGTFTNVDQTSTIDNAYHIPSSTFTTTWANGTWGGFDGYPKVSTAIASRGVFANTTANPTAIWFSQQDNIFYYNNYKATFKYDGRPGVPKFYSVSDINDNITAKFPASDDSIPFEYVLTDELSREIRWLYPSRNLEFGTDVGEFTYTGFSLGTSAIEFQSSYGAVYQNPLKVGNATIFVLKDGRTLGRILFNFQTQANKVTNLNILAPNVLNDFRKFYTNYDTPFIKNIQWDHVRKVLWVVTTTGDVFSVTTSFNIDQFGWQSHTFRSPCTDILITKNRVGNYTQDTPLFVFENTLEHMVPRNEYPIEALNNIDQIYVEQDNIFNYHYLDSAETLNDFTKNTVVWTFKNPEFLNQAVHVFADNQYLAEKQLSPKAVAYIDNLLFTAVNDGEIGNSISLVFNGTDSVSTVVDAWNTANPANQVDVEYKVGDPNQIPPAQTVNLVGAGYNLVFDNLLNNVTGDRFSTITAGFPFKNRLKKTLVYSGSNTESGLEAYKRIDRIEIKFFRSVYAKVGSEDTNLRDIAFPLGNDVLNLQDYNYIEAFSGNSEPEHTVIVESDLPLPLNILTITTRGVLAD